MFVCGGRIIHVFMFTTSGGKLLGVDDFGSIFLSRGDLHAPPDHRERTPGKKRLEQYKVEFVVVDLQRPSKAQPSMKHEHAQKGEAGTLNWMILKYNAPVVITNHLLNRRVLTSIALQRKHTEN